MKYLLILALLLPFSVTAEKEKIYIIGTELESKKHNSLVLYHYKNDVLRINFTRDIFNPNQDSLYDIAVDSRDLYKVRKGDKIKLLESFRDGDIFKVQLLKKDSKRDYYFVETESLKHYTLIEPKSSSS